LPLLIKWLEKNGKHLYRINFLGGETFYQKELDTILEVIKKIKNKNLVINIVSNLMVKEDVVKKYIEKIENMLKDRQVGGLDILASIDGWGPEAEYARHGLECEKWLKLFNYLCSKRWMRIGTQQTITSLTIKSVPELINVIKKYQDKRIIEMHISLVEKRPWMHPSVFGRNFWREDFEKILNMLPKKTTRENILKNYMEGIYKSLPDQQPDLKQVAELKHFLNQLDQRRNTNWREIYPYLDI
jgi:MoaA/NifB/PqqE/SkfB family radical SAM enzyme